MGLVKFSGGAGKISSRTPVRSPCAAPVAPLLPAAPPAVRVTTVAPFTRPPRAPLWPWAVALLSAGLVGIGYTMAHPPEGLARIHDRRVVYACWKEQQKTSLPLESQQFIAVFCEELEKQFAQRYGRFP